MSAPATIGPFPGREDEPVPAPALLAQHALALYWAALDAIDALDDLDQEDVDQRAARASVRRAEVRLWEATNKVRVPTLEARRAQPARPTWPFPTERADALF